MKFDDAEGRIEATRHHRGPLTSRLVISAVSMMTGRFRVLLSLMRSCRDIIAASPGAIFKRELAAQSWPQQNFAVSAKV